MCVGLNLLFEKVFYMENWSPLKKDIHQKDQLNITLLLLAIVLSALCAGSMFLSACEMQCGFVRWFDVCIRRLEGGGSVSKKT